MDPVVPPAHPVALLADLVALLAAPEGPVDPACRRVGRVAPVAGPVVPVAVRVVPDVLGGPAVRKARADREVPVALAAREVLAGPVARVVPAARAVPRPAPVDPRDRPARRPRRPCGWPRRPAAARPG